MSIVKAGQKSVKKSAKDRSSVMIVFLWYILVSPYSGLYLIQKRHNVEVKLYLELSNLKSKVSILPTKKWQRKKLEGERALTPHSDYYFYDRLDTHIYMLWWRYTSLWLIFLWQAGYTYAICCDGDTPHSNYYFYDRLDTQMLYAVMKTHLTLIIILW